MLRGGGISSGDGDGCVSSEMGKGSRNGDESGEGNRGGCVSGGLGRVGSANGVVGGTMWLVGRLVKDY